MRTRVVPPLAAFLLTLLTALPAHGAEAPPKLLSLKEVLERVKDSEAMLALRAGVEASDAEVKKAWTLWQPTINAVGSVTYNSVEAKFDQGALVAGVAGALGFTLTPQQLAALPEPTVIQPHLQLAGVLSLSQTLFNITVLRAPGVAKAARRANEAQADAVQDDLMFQAAALYATLGGLRALDAASERAVTVAEQRLNDARVQLEAGTATKLALTRAETDKIVAQSQHTSLQANRRALLAGLSSLLAARDAIDVSDERVASYVKDAPGESEARRSIAARKAALEAAEKAIGLWDLAWLPTLAADGKLLYTNVEGFSGEQFSAQGTLNLVIPLYDAGRRYAEKDLAEARASQARHALEQERLQARAFLEEARSTMESARAEREQAQAQLRLATEAVQQAEELSKSGLATNLDLSDADSKRFAADRLVAQKQLEEDLAVLRAHYAAGGRLLQE